MKKQEKMALLMSFQLLLSSLVGCSKNLKKIENSKPIETSILLEDFNEINSTEIPEYNEELIEFQEIQVELPKEVQKVDFEIQEEQEEVSLTSDYEEKEIVETTDKENEIIEDPIESTNQEISIIDTILLDNKTLGTKGRLYFNETCSVGLNNVSLYDGEVTQSVVDKKDSAAIFNFGNCIVIADHKNQEFSILKNTQIGDIVYIKNSDNSIDSYSCIEIGNGNNTGHELVMNDGRIVSEMSDCDIVMYTCNDNWHNVTITLWKKEDEKVLKKQINNK